MDSNNMDEDGQKQLITVVFRDKIASHLNPSHKAVAHMLQDGLITAADFTEILAKFLASGATPAIQVLLEKIATSQEQRVYRRFVDALAGSDDETCQILAADIQGLTLSSESQENEELFRNVIRLYSPDLMQMDPREILPHIQLSVADKERILAIREMKGNRIGALYLVLELSRCPGDSWHANFLQALRAANQNILADKLAEAYQVNKDPSGATNLCSKKKALEESEDIKTHEDAYESSGEEGDVNEGGAPSQDDTNISRNLNSLDGEEKDGLRSPFQQTGPQNRREEMETEKQEEEGSEKQLTNKASTSADDKPTELYEDQLEVALPAIEGKNALILMPTGAGKTVVAASVIEKVINDSDDKMKCKVIFMVPTGPLVKQQQERLEERLRPSRNFHITGLKGDTMSIPLKAVLEAHNVIVLTAAILDTALKDGDNLVELESLALLVFDECHHCMKDHVYNTIMKRYKYEMFEHPTTKLPQIVGLTATTGTGKAKSQLAAEDHVFQLICNLDTPHISVVERNKNKLQERINLPEEMSPICVDPRVEDPFKAEVCKIMCDIENIMKVEAESTLNDLRSIPRDKKNTSYMQWLSKVHKESGKTLDDGDKLRTIRTCVKHLQDYHISLGINAEVRTKDAYDYLNLKYTEMSNPDQMEAYNDTDFRLLQMYMRKRRQFGEVSKNPKYGNPLLKTLETIILREYKQTPKSRALLFCKTIEATKALKTWIEETECLSFLTPNRMVGGGGGQTSAQQKEILDRFREGKHKILVCTNVLEEGLDVAACNLVMRLNYVPSDTGHVQSRGRGRAKNSKSYLIASSECNHAAWEYANKARSGMSQRAVESIRSLPIDELQDRMLRRQKEDYNQHKLEAQSAQNVRPRHAGEFQLLCGGCRKFACSTLDIGVFSGFQHIVLDERFLVERSNMRQHPKPKKIDHEFSKIGKVHCKECNQDWGILAIICQQTLPIIKISSFIIEKEDESGEKLRYLEKKWIDAKKIFPVRVLNREELQTLKKMNIPDF